MIDITPNQNRGVLKLLVRTGEGDASPLLGDVVKINYTENLRNGTLLYTTFGTDFQPEFELGRDTSLGWNIAIPTMKKGEISLFDCNSKYTAKKVLDMQCTRVGRVYSIELLSWKRSDSCPTRNGAIEKYQTLVFGKGDANVKYNDLVDVKLVGRYEDIIFEKNYVTFIVGECSEVNVIRGIEIALQEFDIGETSRVRIQPEYAFGARGYRERGVPPNATVDYTITLVAVAKYKYFPTQSSLERVRQAALCETYAAWYLDHHKHSQALNYLKEIVGLLSQERDLQDDSSRRRNKLLLRAYLNIGKISLRLNDYLGAKNAAIEALKIDPFNLKARHQRKKANSALNKKRLPKADLKHDLEEKSTNSQKAKKQKT